MSGFRVSHPQIPSDSDLIARLITLQSDLPTTEKVSQTPLRSIYTLSPSSLCQIAVASVGPVDIVELERGEGVEGDWTFKGKMDACLNQPAAAAAVPLLPPPLRPYPSLSFPTTAVLSPNQTTERELKLAGSSTITDLTR